METHPKIRLDILVETPFRRKLCDLLDQQGVSGYTVFPALAGRGDHMAWSRAGLISDVGKKELVVCIVDATQSDSLLDELKANLSDHIGFITTSAVEVIRPEKFS